MTRAFLLGVVLAASGCASWGGLRPGATRDGEAVKVAARGAAADREALEAVLPLFLSAEARREKSGELEKTLFSKPSAFIGKRRFPKTGPAVVEVNLDLVFAALQRAGLIRPAGFESGPELVLIALGDRAAGPDGSERFAADALETALFGRGIQAQDADDTLRPLKHPLKAKTERDAAAEAAAGGWAWLAAGRVESAARRDPESAAWRARSRLAASLYAAGSSSEPAKVEGAGEAVDVSSLTALSRALEQSAQETALRVETEMARRKAGRATVAVFLTGLKDAGYVRRVLADLRRVPGVAAASLVSWHGLDDMPVLQAYVTGLRADLLMAGLLRQDASLRVGSVEAEDGRLTLEGPEIPSSLDRGD